MDEVHKIPAILREQHIMLGVKFTKGDFLQHQSLKAEMLAQRSDVSACLGTAACLYTHSWKLSAGKVGVSAREGGKPSVKLPRKLLTNRLVPHGKTPGRATHRIKAPTLRLRQNWWWGGGREDERKAFRMIRLFHRVIQYCSWKCQHWEL
jgi:hypothetical protein